MTAEQISKTPGAGRLRRHRPLLAVVLMLCATAAFVSMQGLVKLAREAGMDTTEVMFFRTAPGLPFLWWILRRRGQGLGPQQPRNLLARSLFGCIAMGSNFTAMRWLTLAQFSTFGLSQPVFVALASPPLLGEPVRARTWSAMVLAALGAFVLLAPGWGAGGVALLPAGLALLSAGSSAMAHVWVRKSTERDPVERVVFHFAAWVSLLSLGAGLARGYFQQLPAELSPLGFGMLVVGLAGFGTLGQMFMTRSYAYGEASVVSLVGYSGVLLSMLADALFWDVAPAAHTWVGAGLMVLSGVVLVRGERGR